MDGSKPRDKAGRAPGPRAPTRARLEARALYYLERFSTTGAHLRRVLLRRALRDAAELGLEASEVHATVDAVVAHVQSLGLIDDRVFAANRARRLALAGRSPARIRLALAEKGLSETAIAAAMREVTDELPDPELAAVIAYARRRRLGPWAPAEVRADRQERDLAALARAGFSYRVARMVVEASDPSTLEEASRGEPEP